MSKKQRLLKDKNGKKVAVILGIEEYEKLLDKAEELWAIRAYNEPPVRLQSPWSRLWRKSTVTED